MKRFFPYFPGATLCNGVLRVIELSVEFCNATLKPGSAPITIVSLPFSLVLFINGRKSAYDHQCYNINIRIIN